MPAERTAFVAAGSRSATSKDKKFRYCVVDTADGLAEMIQTIVSTDDATLYLDVVEQQQQQQLLLAILLQPNNRAYVVDVGVLGGGGRGLDARQEFALVQLTASLGGGGGGAPPDENQDQDEDDEEGAAAARRLARRKSLEVGTLPSLRGVLESPSVAKVVFDATRVAAALDEAYGVSLRGAADVQRMEQTGRCRRPAPAPAAAAALAAVAVVAAAARDPRLAFHRKFTLPTSTTTTTATTATATATATARHGQQGLRDLRTCLE